MKDKSSSSEKPNGPNALAVKVAPGEDIETASARTVMGPHVASADAIRRFTHNTLGELSLSGLVTAMEEAAGRVSAGDMRDVEAMLVSQAMALNALFADLTRRAAANLGNGATFEAGEALMRMALRSQSQCRSTLETLATVKNPPVVFAKQANFANGPQQVNNAMNTPSRMEKIEIATNELLETNDEQPLDPRASGKASAGNPEVETVGEIHRPKKLRR